jgi:hypothetical protein
VQQLCQGPLNKYLVRILMDPPCFISAFVEDSKPNTELRPSVRVCVGPNLLLCS